MKKSNENQCGFEFSVPDKEIKGDPDTISSEDIADSHAQNNKGIVVLSEQREKRIRQDARRLYLSIAARAKHLFE